MGKNIYNFTSQNSCLSLKPMLFETYCYTRKDTKNNIIKQGANIKPPHTMAATTDNV